MEVGFFKCFPNAPKPDMIRIFGKFFYSVIYKPVRINSILLLFVS